MMAESKDCDGDDIRMDVSLIVGRTTFYSDRRLLAAFSPYFAAMFESEMIESRSGVVDLHGVCPLAMDILLKYVNCGEMSVPSDAVPRLLETATMLQFGAVVDFCLEQLSEKLTTSNCLGIMNLADRLAFRQLHLRAKQTAMWCFVQVAQESEILDIPFHYLVDYLSNDALRVQSEMQVFQAVAAWIEHDRSARSARLEELLAVVRFSDLSLKEIRMVAVSDVIKACPCVRAIVREIWMTRVSEQSVERLSGSGGSSQYVTPLSDVSPAESVAAPAVAADQDSHKRSTDLMGAVAAVCKEKVMAQRFLMAKRRCIPTVPAVVKLSDDRTHPPELIYWDAIDGRTKSITSMTKVFQKNHVALGFKACAVGNLVVVIGGEFQYGRNNWNTSAWKYNIFTKTWSFLNNLHSPRRHHTLCTLNDFVYIIGGIGRFRVAVNTAEKICLKTGILSDVAPLPNPVYSAMSVGYEGKIYVLDTNVYRYDPTTADLPVWTHLRYIRLPHEIQLHSALAHSNGIYLVATQPARLILLNLNSTVATAAEDRSGGERKPAYTTIGQFDHTSENACIANERIYSFSSCPKDGLIIESYDIATDTFTVDGRADSDHVQHVGAATVHYGCFALPNYSV